MATQRVVAEPTQQQPRSEGFRFVQRLFFDERKTERLTISLPLTYLIESCGNRVEGRATTANIGGGGLRFSVPEMVAASSPCYLNLKLPNHLEPLCLRGLVAWCRVGEGRNRTAYEVGITLTIPSDQAHATYSLYCRFIATQLLDKQLGR
jgi:hypothetical protein